MFVGLGNHRRWCWWSHRGRVPQRLLERQECCRRSHFRYRLPGRFDKRHQTFGDSQGVGSPGRRFFGQQVRDHVG